MAAKSRVEQLLEELVAQERKEDVREAKVSKLSTIKNWIWIAITIGGVIVPITVFFVHLRDVPKRVTAIESHRLNERVMDLEETNETVEAETISQFSEIQSEMQVIEEDLKELKDVEIRDIKNQLQLVVCYVQHPDDEMSRRTCELAR